MTQEDAIRIIVEVVRTEPPREFGHYGYDIYIPNLIYRHLLRANRTQDQRERDRLVNELSADFYAAAWELCRRGIIRPGVQTRGAQATDDGSGGNGYSITPFGKQWLAEADHETFVPTEPERFAQMLAPFRVRLGAGFHQRAQEAIRCYGAHAYLACCAMCGAAAESVLLARIIAGTP